MISVAAIDAALAAVDACCRRQHFELIFCWCLYHAAIIIYWCHFHASVVARCHIRWYAMMLLHMASAAALPCHYAFRHMLSLRHLRHYYFHMRSLPCRFIMSYFMLPLRHARAVYWLAAASSIDTLHAACCHASHYYAFDYDADDDTLPLRFISFRAVVIFMPLLCYASDIIAFTFTDAVLMPFTLMLADTFVASHWCHFWWCHFELYAKSAIRLRAPLFSPPDAARDKDDAFDYDAMLLMPLISPVSLRDVSGAAMRRHIADDAAADATPDYRFTAIIDVFTMLIIVDAALFIFMARCRLLITTLMPLFSLRFADRRVALSFRQRRHWCAMRATPYDVYAMSALSLCHELLPCRFRRYSATPMFSSPLSHAFLDDALLICCCCSLLLITLCHYCRQLPVSWCWCHFH